MSLPFMLLSSCPIFSC